MKKTITILTPTFNEEDNIDELYSRISIITKKNPNYSFEHLFIDNSSNDGTVKKRIVIKTSIRCEIYMI